MHDALNIAIFCDFENIAIGVRDAKFESLDINLVIGRLLDKGKIVVKKAYCDWGRYKSHRKAMHEAAFEMIEIPHISISGKNSADIRLVVDALDLCYTKGHVDTFVILSGDSDFSPLVSKLRENNKQVIGVGVKNSTSDLLVENCDEFIYYDDLVRRKKGRGAAKREKAAAKDSRKVDKNGTSTKTAASKKKDDDESGSAQDAFELVLETIENLFQERDSSLWSSMVKQTIKRKRPNFNESSYGFRTFSQLIEDLQNRGLLEVQKDEKSGGYLILGFGPKA